MRLLQKLTFGLSLFLPLLGLAATLTPPERSPEVGHMQKWESDIKGTWMIFPPDYVEVESDTNSQIVYFVPLRTGTVYLTFLYIEDGTILHEQIAVPIGTTTDPEPEPEPAPQINLTQTEKQAAISAFQAVISGIDAGTIRTPQGARSAFKQTLTQKAANCSNGYCQISPELSAALEEWTEQTDFTSLETVKASFQNILKELK